MICILMLETNPNLPTCSNSYCDIYLHSRMVFKKEDHPAIFMPYVELDVVRRVKQIDWLTYVIQKS